MVMNDIKNVTRCEERLFWTANCYRLTYQKDKNAYKAINPDINETYWFKEIEVESAEIVRLIPKISKLHVYLDLMVPGGDSRRVKKRL